MRLPAAVVLATVVALGLASCSSDDPAPRGASTTTAGRSTTTSAGPASRSTTTAPPLHTPTVEGLRTLIPDASEFGGSWGLQTGATDIPNPPLQAAIDQTCPDLNRIKRPDRTRDVVGSFADNDQRLLEVAFDLEPERTSDRRWAALIARIDRCAPIVYATSDGTQVTITVTAGVEHLVGEQAAKVSLSAEIRTSAIPQGVRSNTYIYAFRRGPVGVTILGSDAVDSTGTVHPIETLLLDRLATAEDLALQSLEQKS